MLESYILYSFAISSLPLNTHQLTIKRFLRATILKANKPLQFIQKYAKAYLRACVQ